jgi:hypothetical protein
MAALLGMRHTCKDMDTTVPYYAAHRLAEGIWEIVGPPPHGDPRLPSWVRLAIASLGAEGEGANRDIPGHCPVCPACPARQILHGSHGEVTR